MYRQAKDDKYNFCEMYKESSTYILQCTHMDELFRRELENTGYLLEKKGVSDIMIKYISCNIQAWRENLPYKTCPSNVTYQEKSLNKAIWDQDIIWLHFFLRGLHTESWSETYRSWTIEKKIISLQNLGTTTQ